jgi:hypothetical protein|tara:strand:+ start:316 stop:705 length:390 start_codon:yes stop_codon:yes gene_type:complete
LPLRNALAKATLVDDAALLRVDCRNSRAADGSGVAGSAPCAPRDVFAPHSSTRVGAVTTAAARGNRGDSEGEQGDGDVGGDEAVCGSDSNDDDGDGEANATGVAGACCATGSDSDGVIALVVAAGAASF